MLEARGITYAHPGAREPLYRDFDLAVGPGERVALSAPSGFGKTTLCRLLAGYERPQSGKILVDGVPLPKRGTCPVQLILQHPEAAVDPRMRMERTLAEAGEVPQGLLDDLGIQEKWLTRFPHELSGGERQKVFIARALAQEPSILILDEPTSALDPKNQLEVLRAIRAITHRDGLASVLVLHDVNLALRFCDRFLLVRDGQVVAQGGREAVTERTLLDTYGMPFKLIDVDGVRIAVPRGREEGLDGCGAPLETEKKE